MYHAADGKSFFDTKTTIESGEVNVTYGQKPAKLLISEHFGRMVQNPFQVPVYGNTRGPVCFVVLSEISRNTSFRAYCL
jgi:hypothetical protein